MAEFSHDELQQVIRKYDSEYKRLKKLTVGKILLTSLIITYRLKLKDKRLGRTSSQGGEGQ